ncbi:MAG: FKBP-type peptidyl-prolyl cis-trans isomerase [Ignavibacteriae bacterium]|nr:MAG: FKBP-type peptidyl-prolyl cis-trans isomerase [Ignavibacteriota bacterium]
MKKIIAIALMLLLCEGALLAQKKGAPKSQKEKVGYSIGVNIGKNMKMEGLDIDEGFLIQGLKDGLNNTKMVMTDKEMEAAMKTFQQEMTTKMQAKQKTLGDKNKKEGDTFLAANKKKDGVITLPSGLQYKIIKAGTGAKPTASQTVKCHYRGTLIDGTEFDSSYKRGEPAEFPVGQVIKGWVEALQLMPVGSKWQLFIPSDLAYGPNGQGQIIGPNAVLIFDIELLSIK